MSDVNVHLSCLHCYAKDTYQPAAMHLTLLSTGVAVLSFFCTGCRRENRQEVGADIGERLTREGVSAHLVNVPLEVEERLAAPPPDILTPAIVAVLEDMSLEVFDRLIHHDLGLNQAMGEP